MVVYRHRDQELHGFPNGIYHFGLERAHDWGDLQLSSDRMSTPIVSGPIQRLVDGRVRDPFTGPSSRSVATRSLCAYPRGLLGEIGETHHRR